MRTLARTSGALFTFGLALLAGCSNVPSTSIQQPLSARPPVDNNQALNNGSIFRPGRGLALFEDRRARFVGDILTVNLVEKTSANRKSETNDTRAASASIDIPTPMILGKSPNAIGDTRWESDASTSQAFKDNDTNSNTITGTITVTVIEVLENGYLKVAGEKRISVNNDTDYIRLAGVVNPIHVSANNVVDSTRMGDATIESKNAQGLDSSQLASMMARFFLTLVPF